MRIGVFSPILRSGGTEKVIAKLSFVWTALRHEVVFFTYSKPEPVEFEHECIARECKPEGRWNVGDAKNYQNKYHLDLVVFNGGLNDLYVPPMSTYFRGYGVRTMVIVHHAMNNWAFSGCNAEDFDKDDLFGQLDCLVCVDRIQALWWSRRFDNVFYIPNPVSIDLNRNAQIRVAPQHKLVWVGRADDWGKRVELAIEAFRLIRAKVPDATLSIIGLKPKGKLVEYPGLEYVGRVQNTRPYLEDAAVNLVTTLWEVTVPQVVLEAGAMGVPTVAMDLPVLRGHGLDGIGGVVLARNVEDMSEKVVDLLQDGAKRRELGAAAINDVMNRANPTAVEERWGGLLNSIAQNRITEY